MVGLVLFGGMLVLMLLGIPIVFTIGLASVLGTLVIGAAAPWIIIPSSMINGMDSFPLMAVPFFILAGELMKSRRHRRAAGRVRKLVGRPYPRRSRPCDGRLQHHARHGYRFRAGAGGGDRPDHGAGHGKSRLSPRVRDRTRLRGLADRPDHPAQYHHGHLRGRGRCIGRRTVSRRHRTRADDCGITYGLCLRTRTRARRDACASLSRCARSCSAARTRSWRS